MTQMPQAMNIIEWITDSEIREEYGALTLQYDIAALLVAARQRTNLSREQFATMAGITHAYLIKLERGEANPTLKRLGAILALVRLRAQVYLVPLVPEGDDVPAVQPSATLAQP